MTMEGVSSGLSFVYGRRMAFRCKFLSHGGFVEFAEARRPSD